MRLHNETLTNFRKNIENFAKLTKKTSPVTSDSI